MRINIGDSDLDFLKSMALRDIEQFVSDKRKEYITIIPGQEMVYMTKVEEARRYLLTKEGEFPLLQSESDSIEMPIEELAKKVVEKWLLWQKACASIEAIRASSKLSIKSAESVTELYNVKLLAISSLSMV